MELDYRLIGERVKIARKNQEMTQEELAEKTNLSTTHINCIENGRTKLSIQSLIDISNTLEVSTDWLLQGNLKATKSVNIHEIVNILNDCSNEDAVKLVELLRAVKNIVI